METISVLIAEDHGIVRLGLTMLVREIYPASEIREASNFKSTLQQVELKDFNLLILDINIPGGDNVQMIDNIKLRKRHLPILVFSSYDESIYAARYLRAGANGYLQKETPPDEIKNAIHKVIHGETYASPAMQKQLFRSFISSRWDNQRDKLHELSDREEEIMRLLAKGISPTEIKMQLNIQLSTVSTHKARIFEKLQVSNVVQLVEKLKEIDDAKRSAG
ncbi:MAG: DNA-binding response regulator [Citrobacter freundii]|nr:MAG: DNA-binding response regulator [Citrobacter freundii]